MDMFVTAIVLLFILKIRYPARVLISACICRRYEPKTLSAFLKYEYNLKRHEKALLDSRFLYQSKSYNIFQKSLQFKLYIHNSGIQRISRKTSRSRNKSQVLAHKHLINITTQESQDSFKSHGSWLDFSALRFFLTRNLQKYCKTITTTHSKELHTLGGKLQLSSCSPDNVIFNYSNRILSN